MKCPRCGRRAFDILPLPNEQVEITLKCPHCHQIVAVPCYSDMTDRIKPKTNATVNDF
jgi:hypothetical protein